MTEEALETCWLCERPLGTMVQLHHPVPRSKKGRVTVPVHPICHKTIHKYFANSQLARIGTDRNQLTANEEVRRSVDWVATKSADFDAPVR